MIARTWRPDPPKWGGLLLSAPLIAILLVLVLYPFLRLIQVAVGPPKGLANFPAVLDNKANLTVFVVTFRDAALVTLLAVLLGSLVAWSLRTTRRRSTRLVLLSAVFVPVWMGTVIKNYALTVLLGRQGILNQALQGLHLTSGPVGLLYTQFAVVLGMFYALLPYAVLPLYVAFLTIDADLILAAESLGATRAAALRSVVVPLAVPGILATAVIVYVISLGFYVTPVVLGGTTSPFTATLIASDMFDFFDFAGAAVSSMMLLAGATVTVVLGVTGVGRQRLERALA